MKLWVYQSRIIPLLPHLSYARHFAIPALSVARLYANWVDRRASSIIIQYLNHIHQLRLRFGVHLDVPARRRKARMTRQSLNVSQ
jgi:hypothetical protein